MLIKEIMTFSMGVLIALFIANPLHFRESVRKMQFQILKEVTRTDNWGNPDIFQHPTRKNSKGSGKIINRANDN